MRKIVTLTCFIFLILEAFSQTPYKYWVGFADKKNNSFSTAHPEKFLSPKAIERREKQHISITEQDLPVSIQYVDSLRKLGFFIQYTSKWLNGVTIGANDPGDIDKLKNISFISEIKLTYKPKLKTEKKDSVQGTKSFEKCIPSESYGQSAKQIEIMNGQCLHQMGYRGNGMLIAVIDAGFFQVDSFPAFDSLWKNNQIRGYRNFVNPTNDFFNTHTHGMSVLSIMGGNVPDTLIGTAPKANYELIITEDGQSEYPVEEYNWCAGVEYADSIGADVVNSSLGYTSFNDSSMSHTYKDMDGNTTPCAKAAKIAASKGMIVVVSAGNEGGDPWKHLSTPADARNILTIGAVDSFRRYAYFSSRGPTADGRIKPDITTMGYKTFVQAYNKTFSRGSGTSYSSPLTAGMVACLWQAFPERSNFDIMDAIRASASLSPFPNDSMGHGIPDFDKAFTILNNIQKNFTQPYEINVSPNPFKAQLHLAFNVVIEKPFTIEFIDGKGIILYKNEIEAIYSSDFDFLYGDAFPQGLIFCRITLENRTYIFKLIKL